MNDLIFNSATELSRLIREGQVSALEVVSAHLERIAEVNPKINAVVQLEGAARQEAEEADRALSRGEIKGPLHGVPFTVKDWIETKGVVCTAGFERWRHHVPKEDATVVARLRAAGGILLGKTNVMVDNPIYGRTNNPYDLRRSPAGSSSGEAAIIAAGGSPLGLGSDSGGSIRQPAHVCGIAGLKPSTGRLPLTGHLPFISAVNDPRTTIGPMVRHVADLALALPILMGPDWRDASVVPVPLNDWREVRLEGLRVAFYTKHQDANPAPEVEEVARAAAGALEQAGLTVGESLPPRLDEVYDITRHYWQRPESEDAESWQPDGEAKLSSEEVEKHLFAWDRFRRGMIRFMEDYDVILTPAADLPAAVHGEPEGGIAYTLTYSLTGYPCVVVRAGTSPEGLPIGVQVVARPWRDEVALAVANALEGALGGWQPPAL